MCKIPASTWIQSVNAYVYSGLTSAWGKALFQQLWHLRLQLGCIYYISYISFLTDSVNPFVTETEECHINLLFHYDNSVLCSYIKPIVHRQACWGSLVALAAIIIGGFIILKLLSSCFSFYVNTQLQDHVFFLNCRNQSCGNSCPVTLYGKWTLQMWSCH